jgi:beta-phosphoglucomutase-like phosphatase (HAD superfamily)
LKIAAGFKYNPATQAFNTPPRRCIVVEDSVSGVTAAVRAGMKVYGHAAFTPAESLRKAGAISFDNMMELQTILGNGHKVKIYRHEATTCFVGRSQVDIVL